MLASTQEQTDPTAKLRPPVSAPIFASQANGQGPAPIKTAEGWLHLAHGIRNTAAGLRSAQSVQQRIELIRRHRACLG